MSKPLKVVYVQGLTGMGLVGFNVAQTVRMDLDAYRIATYSEFFPTVAFVDDGKLKTRTIEVFKAQLNNTTVYSMTGSQPEENLLTSAFISKFEQDMSRWHGAEPVDLYLAFGAFITRFELPNVDEREVNELAEKKIKEEKLKERRLFIATAGGLEYTELKSFLAESSSGTDNLVLQESEGYISGLNGVLPAHIADKLDIPTATIMVETAIPDFVGSDSPLYRFLGLCGARRGLQFLQDLLKTDFSLDYVDDNINSLEKSAIRQCAMTIRLGIQAKEGTPPRKEMYV